jgi:hypothetical protein
VPGQRGRRDEEKGIMLFCSFDISAQQLRAPRLRSRVDGATSFTFFRFGAASGVGSTIRPFQLSDNPPQPHRHCHHPLAEESLFPILPRLDKGSSPLPLSRAKSET